MRPTKTLVLALLAAISATVLLSPAVAQATSDIVMCKAEEEPVCSGPSWGEKLLKEGGASDTVFKGAFEEKCKKSELHAKVLTNNNTILAVDIEKLTYSECTPCTTVTVVGLPYGGEVNVDAKDKYSWITPFVVEFSGCLMAMKCKFETSPLSLSIDNLFTGQHILLAIEEEIGFSGGSAVFCGKSTKWSATYTITSPLSFWFSLKTLP